jgi:S-layer homology domain
VVISVSQTKLRYLQDINTNAQGSVSNTMTQNKLKTKLRLVSLLIGTALLSNSAAVLALSVKAPVAKSKTSATSLKANDATAPESQPIAPKTDDVAPKADDKTPDKPSESQPVAPKTDDATPKADDKAPDKPSESQPVAPKTDDATPKADDKTPDKPSESQPVAPKTDDATPKADDKNPDKPSESQPVAPKTDDATPKADDKNPDKPSESQPVAPKTDDATPKADDKNPKDDGTTPGTKQPGGAVKLSDVAGNWAEPFITVLADQGIIAGYPDGTFQPDRPVTRAEFAALIKRAFPDAPEVQPARAFRDVPRGFWAADAIAKASSTGFMAGDPNGSFRPTSNIKRIESLVAFVNGTKLNPDGTAANIDELFTDTPQVPSFGRNALIAAANSCVAVSVNYPNGKAFNPNQDATRADVAAFLHQILVAAGRLPKLPADSPAQQYIVNCEKSATPPAVATKITEQDILGKTGIPAVPNVEQSSNVPAPVNAPVGGITTPSGFGANWGDVFFGAGYQERIPVVGRGPGGPDQLGIGAGLGLGDARNAIGLEASYSTSSGGNTRLLDRGNVNFKLHKLLGENVSAAVGWENAISGGYTPANNPGSTLYGVVTGVLPVGDTSNFTASIGVGNGRFRNFGDIVTDTSRVNVFGSLGFRASENFALAADYNGRNFSIGLPITFKLSDNVGIQVTPSLLDIGGDPTSNQSRFGIGGGIGIRF